MEMPFRQLSANVGRNRVGHAKTEKKVKKILIESVCNDSTSEKCLEISRCSLIARVN
jgi:hypothetical protein